MISSKYIAKCSSTISCFRSMSVVATKLVYSEFGEPAKVIKKVEEKLPVLTKNEVLVKILAAPVNPADINTIQGRYPVKPVFPAVPGNEFVGEILEVGENALKFAPGDWVVPFATGMGTWTSHAIYSESSLLKVPKELGIVKASTMTVNPTTAYRMLKEYVTLVPGRTCVIQNGANSAVGQAVIQLCKAWGLKSVGIVRNRPEIADLKKFLKQLGADEVLTEEEVRSTQIFKEKKYDKPKLGLNCVGGKSSTEMLRHLADKAVMVTYGGMSREPITIPTSALIFKDICFHGFWMTRWTAENAGNPLRMKMFDDLIDLMLEDKLKGPVASEVPIDNYQLALANALSFQGFVGQKYILTF